MWWSAWSRNQTERPVAGSSRRCSQARQSASSRVTASSWRHHSGHQMRWWPLHRAAVERQQPFLDPLGQRRVVRPGGLGEVEELALDGTFGDRGEVLIGEASGDRRGGHAGGVLLEGFDHGALDQRLETRERSGGRFAGQVVVIHGFALGWDCCWAGGGVVAVDRRPDRRWPPSCSTMGWVGRVRPARRTAGRRLGRGGARRARPW